MSKEKKLKMDETKKETPFYYETIGFIALIFVIIVFGQLGRIGEILNIFFMVAFGDWYWLTVLFILFFGLSNILTHRRFDFKNQRYIGYLICTLGLIILSHFSLHKAIVADTTGRSYLSLTWNHYRNFITSNSFDMNQTLGGGIIGGFIFFVIYYLLGTIGIILVSIIIIILGFAMIINKSVVDIAKYVFAKLKDIKKVTCSFNRFFKYEIGKEKPKPELEIYTKDKVIPLKVLDTYQNEMNFSFQEKQCMELKSLIISVFNNFNIEFREIDTKVSYAISTFKYYIYTNYDYEKLIEKLRDLIEEKVCVTRYNNNLIIEINNKFVSLLTARNLLMKQTILNNYLIPLGINSENELEEVDITRDGNILILGKENVGIRNFIYYFICSLFMKISIANYEFVLFDETGTFSHLALFSHVDSGNIIEYLNRIITEIDEKIKVIKNHGAENINDYNKSQELEGKDLMRRKFIVFNYSNDENKKIVEDKLMYIMQMGRLCGTSIIIVCRDITLISSIILSIIKIKLIFKLRDFKDSMTILNDSKATYLDNKGEVIYINKDKQIRMQTPLISENEINKIIKAF